MPIFQELLDQDDARVPPSTEAEIEASTTLEPRPVDGLRTISIQRKDGSLSRRISEESIRTELCDGPVPDSPPNATSPRPDLSMNTTSDRIELIERLKKGESPTWSPKRHLESLFRRNGSREQSSSPRPKSSDSPSLPSVSYAKEASGRVDQEAENAERMRQGLAIERPRSALHSGDFTQNASSPRYNEAGDKDRREPASSRNPWLATSPPRDFTPFKFERLERRIPFADPPDGFRSPSASLSSSLSSSFVYKHPTSPLVQSESNDDLDLSLPISNIDIGPPNPSKASRRRTLGGFHSVQNDPIVAQRIPTMRHEGTWPYQAHQPRRSLTSVPSLSLTGSSPQKLASSRRPSFGLESSSPLHQTSMVGSYEESILRGRMSTTPSKPLDFLAQIGVLGLGNCKSSLRCPTHVTLPFPAVFYSYASTSHGRSKCDDGPSPYVGQIDLENGLPNPTEVSAARKKSRQLANSAANRPQRDGDDDVDMPDLDHSGEVSDHNVRKAAKQKRRSNSPKAPPGGSYRIPEKGQIQIIIKNQNKTAVKLFLVPYDLAGMEPGTKTFIRHRSYTAGGPIIENVPDTGNDKPALRYLAHLHICCPAKGRYYLYKSIRVVFANRVPDGKEKLRNEVTIPEPRFTPYKPIRVMHHFATQQTSGPGASLAAEKAFRRRSSGFSFGQQLPPFDPSERMTSLPQLRARASSVQDRGLSLGHHMGRSGKAGGQILAPTPVHPGATAAAIIPPLSFAKGEIGGYVRNGANSAGSGGAAAAEGLLSLRLRSLGMQTVCRQETDGKPE
ncbi:hypothetical protein VM1G_04543 [Cytospora mali]|uniref:Atos-like conserved domain-containing protein n=1 Tax=Cytospora mali TaxID=578113 RepID=A0A194VW26_CYTMA|nr:hypothetical protein VM1G_04543 [Valsa mali]